MKITALIENTSARGLPTEHGLSLFVETAEHKFLFDMGQTDLFARNAETLGIALSKVDFAVLSHGHYDHGGGLNTFLALNDHAPVYMSRYAFEPHYNGTEKNIGLDQGFHILYFMEGLSDLFTCENGTAKFMEANQP